MKIGITLAKAGWKAWPSIAAAGEHHGFESLWVSEHLVFPTRMAGSPMHDSDHPPIPPTTPLFDTGAALAWLAAQTSTIRLGTFVYLLGIRHPFIAARAFATADVLSGGRVEVGVGAGWLREEWDAAGFDPRTRGARLDESLDVCLRLWSEPTVEHHGRFWSFPEVAFEPKPLQQPMPLLVGGESHAAMVRAARYGDGWIGLDTDPLRAEALITELRRIEATEREPERAPLSISFSFPDPTADDLTRFEALGVDRVLVSPWPSARVAVDALGQFADVHGDRYLGPASRD